MKGRKEPGESARGDSDGIVICPFIPNREIPVPDSESIVDPRLDARRGPVRGERSMAPGGLTSGRSRVTSARRPERPFSSPNPNPEKRSGRRVEIGSERAVHSQSAIAEHDGVPRVIAVEGDRDLGRHLEMSSVTRTRAPRAVSVWRWRWISSGALVVDIGSRNPVLLAAGDPDSFVPYGKR